MIDTTMRVSSLTGGYQHFTGFSVVQGGVTIVNSGTTPIPNAMVTLNLAGPSGTGPKTFTTGANGMASYSFNITSYGSYTVSVTGVTLAGNTYNPAANTFSSVPVNVGP